MEGTEITERPAMLLWGWRVEVPLDWVRVTEWEGISTLARGAFV